MNKLLSTALLAAILSTSGFAAGSDPIATDPIEIESGAKLVIENQDGNINDTLLDKSVLVKAGGTGIIDGSFSIANEVITLAFEGNATYSFENGGSDTVINKGTIKLGVPVVSDIVSKSGTGTEGDPIKVAFTSGKSSSDLGKIDQNYDSASSKVTGKIEVVGIDGLTYTGATGGYSLTETDAETSIANFEKVFEGITQKELKSSVSSDATFTVKSGSTYYSVPVSTIPTIQYTVADKPVILAAKLASASRNAAGFEAMTDMGITLKKTPEGNANPVAWDSTSASADGTGWTWTAGSTGNSIDALNKSTASDAVLLKKVTINVDEAASPTIETSGALSGQKTVTVAGNLHNLATVDTEGKVTFANESDTTAVPTFSGTTNYLVLTGNNTYLNDATFDCPVKYTSATAMMTGGTYTKALVIEDDVTIGGNTTIDASKLELASGKKITVNEGATLTLKLGQDE